MANEAEPGAANHRLALLRTIDRKLDHVVETLGRNDVRLGRLKRDVGEVKSDLVLMENRVLTQAHEILRLVHHLSEKDLAGQPT